MASRLIREWVVWVGQKAIFVKILAFPIALNQAGRTTVVLEGQPQICGRLQRLQVGLSNRSTNSAVPGWVDLGGQWVGHKQTKTLEYARKLNISTFPVPVGGEDTFVLWGTAKSS